MASQLVTLVFAWRAELPAEAFERACAGFLRRREATIMARGAKVRFSRRMRGKDFMIGTPSLSNSVCRKNAPVGAYCEDSKENLLLS
jgi:hypothetical protein